MLALTDVSIELEKFYSLEYKPATSKLYTLLKPYLKEDKVISKVNILDCEEEKIIFVKDNIFKLFAEKKLIRLYSDNDLLLCGFNNNSNIEIISEFNCEVESVVLDNIKDIENYNEIMLLILQIQTMESFINLQLAANLKHSEIIDASYFKHYQKGDVIVKQGEEPKEIFEMIIGGADVIRDGNKVGEIGMEEVFGEVSFLTNTPRNADVVANSNCTIRVIPKSEFAQLIKQRPKFIIHIASVLAKRLNNLMEN